MLKGTAHADLTATGARDYPVDVLALVAPGDGPGAIRLHLWARGYACELRARLGGSDSVLFEPGQTCRIELGDEAQRAGIDARLRSGSGQLRGDELALQLSWDLDGAAPLTQAGSVTLPGTSVTVPVPSAPPVPIRGTITGAARGTRERT